MSPICQTFVQNAWRKDLCSNCFKSKEEHDCPKKEFSYNSRRDYSTSFNTGSTRRYVGVAGRSTMFSRNYYGQNSWNPIMLDNSNNDSRLLKSPGLIKGMDSIIKQENEKNRNNNNNDTAFVKNVDDTKTLDYTPLTKSIPSDSWIISSIIANSRDYSSSARNSHQGDSSSDLGSEASQDISGSSGDASCSGVDLRDGDSDSCSVRSEPDSAHEDDPPVQSILKGTQSIGTKRSVKLCISFKEDEELIGFGGDELYSDNDEDYGEDDDDDDDDDDDISVSSSELSPEERDLKHLTERNTNFNSENENLERGIETIIDEDMKDTVSSHSADVFGSSLPSEKAFSDVLAEESPTKQDIKVKLKRSHPIAGAKPQIKSSLNIAATTCLPLSISDDKEEIPMKGIKPQFVSRDEEMKENFSYEELYSQEHEEKFTSIDDISPQVSSPSDVAPKVTSLSDLPPKVTSLSDVSPNFTYLSDVSPKTTSLNDVSQKAIISDGSSKITSLSEVSPSVTKNSGVSPTVELCDVSRNVDSLTDTLLKVTSVKNISPKIKSVNVGALSGVKSLDSDTVAAASSLQKHTTEKTSASNSSNVLLSDLALPCSPPLALPCSPPLALPCSPPLALHCSPPLALPCSPPLALPCSPPLALPCSPPLALPCSPPHEPRRKKSSGVGKETETPCFSNCSVRSADGINSCSTFHTTSINSLVKDGSHAEVLVPKSKNPPGSKPCKSSDLIKELHVSDATLNVIQLLADPEQMDATVDAVGKENLNKINGPELETNSHYDYSVKSAQDNSFPVHSTCNGVLRNRLLTDKRSLNEIEHSKENLEKVRSAVIPLNMITIQRRSSFMESQLDGTIYSPEAVGAVKDLRLCDTVNKADDKNYSEGKIAVRKETLEEVPPITKSAPEESDAVSKLSEVKSKHLQGVRAPCLSEEKSIATENMKEENDRSSTTEANRVQKPVLNSSSGLNETSFSKSCENILDSKEMLSRKSSSTTSLSTFGTPVNPTQAPQQSFLHSGVIRPSSDISHISSIIYSTPVLLHNIKSSHDDPPLTAVIQKSALYASSSCLKGLPSAKPATTPKPVLLRSLDKPRIPVKPGMSSSHIYQPSVLVSKVSSETVPTSVSEPDLSSICSNSETSTSKDTADVSALSSMQENRKPPPTSQAPDIPKTPPDKENVYDVPVTVGSPTAVSSPSSTTISAPSPTSSSSSGYSTTSNLSQQEISDNLMNAGSCQEKEVWSPSCMSPGEATTNSNGLKTSATTEILNEEDSINHYRATFEANRNLISTTLNFNSDNQHMNKTVVPNPSGEDSQDVNESPDVICNESSSDLTEIKGNDNSGIVKPVISASDSRLQPSVENAVQNSHLKDCLQLFTNHSYVNLPPSYENHDFDSYSSFTDDFDDDDDDEYNSQASNGQYVPNEEEEKEEATILRRAERSSSSTPMFRNSVGAVNFTPIHGNDLVSSTGNLPIEVFSKPQAVRSHSVPRSVESRVNPLCFGKSKGEGLSSRFGFVRAAGFFRPSSPPSGSRKANSERGRDRTKKSHSGFLLRKLLKFASGDKSLKGLREHRSQRVSDKEAEREARKIKLQIIHPLDYNTNGVEVIGKPEKRSPACAIPGFNFSSMPDSVEQLRGESSLTQKLNATLAEHMKRSEASLSSFAKPQATKEKDTVRKVIKKNSFLRKRRKPAERKDSEKSEAKPVVTYVRRPSTSSSISDTGVVRNSNAVTRAADSNNNSNQSSNIIYNAPDQPAITQQSSINLGFNSEGRPRPPPPPRKTSLETSNQEVCLIQSNPPLLPVSTQDTIQVNLRAEGDNSSLSSNSSSTRPNRPPPPRRTSSACNSSRGTSRRTQRQKDSVYANLGNARAPFTPLKPGRSSSIRDEEREKRKAPNPPDAESQAELLVNSVNNRTTKGPAPPTPVKNKGSDYNHDYECIPDGSPEKKQKLKEEEDSAHSDLPSRKDKVGSLGGLRSNTMSNFSLEDQYGAVVSTNLEALSNILDQVCNQSESYAHKEAIIKAFSQWSDIMLTSDDPISCGPRLFYQAKSTDHILTVMVTPEAKIEVDTLMIPSPLVTFKDELPSWVLNARQPVDKRLTTSGSVWVLPWLNLCSLEEFSHTSQRLLRDKSSEWEKRICFFLLQVVTALKQLQAKGIEESSLDLVLVIENMDGDSNPRLLMVSPSAGSDNVITHGAFVSLCHCAAAATQLLLGHSQPLDAATKGPVLSPPFTPSPHAFAALITTLREERASSLTKAKCILEAMLFGPQNLKISSEPCLESMVQKWLDLERAKVLQSLIREQSAAETKRSSLLTKFHLYFLVRTNAKALSEALRLLEAPDVTNL